MKFEIFPTSTKVLDNAGTFFNQPLLVYFRNLGNMLAKLSIINKVVGTGYTLYWVQVGSLVFITASGTIPASISLPKSATNNSVVLVNNGSVGLISGDVLTVSNIVGATTITGYYMIDLNNEKGV